MAIGPQLKWIKAGLEKKVHLIVLFIVSLLLSFFIANTTNINLTNSHSTNNPLFQQHQRRQPQRSATFINHHQRWHL